MTWKMIAICCAFLLLVGCSSQRSNGTATASSTTTLVCPNTLIHVTATVDTTAPVELHLPVGSPERLLPVIVAQAIVIRGQAASYQAFQPKDGVLELIVWLPVVREPDGSVRGELRQEGRVVTEVRGTTACMQ